jgi:hypothetical protein
MKHRSAWMIACALLFGGSIAAAEPAAKPPIRGLVSMGAYKFVVRGTDPVNYMDKLNDKPGIFGGIVLLASWREMQPHPGSDIPENNAIDQALEEVRAYNRRNPEKPLAVKLRIWAGYVAPDWAKEIGGPIINVVHKKPRTLGRFWSPAYRHAWARFQEKLAARYDREPLIHEVALTSCMSFTAEPFVLPGEPTVARPLEAAGFKPFQYEECVRESVNDYAPWRETNVDVPLNPIHMPLGNPRGNHAFTEQFMHSCRQLFGRRCIFDNHNLDTAPAKAVLPIYEFMKRMGGPIEFQTGGATPKDFEGTIRYGVSLGANSIELYQDFGGFPYVPDQLLKRWATMVERGTER